MGFSRDRQEPFDSVVRSKALINTEHDGPNKVLYLDEYLKDEDYFPEEQASGQTAPNKSVSMQ